MKVLARKRKKKTSLNPLMPFLFMSLIVLMGMAVGSVFASSPFGDTTTPIKHVVVIFDENISFDHYFGTYPSVIKDASGQVIFKPKPGTPQVNGLTHDLLTNNQNSAQPFLITDSTTCDQDHNYTPEQQAYDKGAADEFVEYTEGSGCAVPYEVMGYYDASLVTAMWNYAQNYALNDNSYDTCYGPSTPGALNLICGQTAYIAGVGLGSSNVNGTQINDADPAGDLGASTTKNGYVTFGINVGDLLNKKNITWGWFQGGFDNVNQSHTCPTAPEGAETDYIPHHEPFQYFSSTQNLSHLLPTSVAMIGHTDQANHQYDLTDFWNALAANNLPAVSYLKAPGYQDGHAGYSGPSCEQEFVVDTINKLEQSPEWKDMAIIICYDDSDGWYDHQAPPVANFSHTSADPFTYESDTPPSLAGLQGRMGYGPRLPLLVISPYSKDNYVDHRITDQTSVLRFIEDNWDLGRIGNGSYDAIAGSLNGMFDFENGPRMDTLILNPDTGRPL